MSLSRFEISIVGISAIPQTSSMRLSRYKVFVEKTSATKLIATSPSQSNALNAYKKVTKIQQSLKPKQSF